jgi:anti-sigma B factor antagonist
LGFSSDEGNHVSDGHEARPDGVHPPAPGPSEFLIQRETTRTGATVIRVRGELDMSSASSLMDVMNLVIVSGGGEVVLDLTECDFMDSSALAWVFYSARELRDLGGSLRLVATHPSLLDLFELTNLPQMVPLFTSVATALDEGEIGTAG